MSIKIDQGDTGGLYPTGPGRNKASQGSQQNDSNNKLISLENRGTQDNIRLTSDAQRAAATEQALANMPATDENRIASIRAAIQNGQYSINAEQIADKILLLERDL